MLLDKLDSYVPFAARDPVVPAPSRAIAARAAAMTSGWKVNPK